ncbi:hypothetical protein ACEPAF_4786 [Sanghuangporus sanghuang]
MSPNHYRPSLLRFLIRTASRRIWTPLRRPPKPQIGPAATQASSGALAEASYNLPGSPPRPMDLSSIIPAHMPPKAAPLRIRRRSSGELQIRRSGALLSYHGSPTLYIECGGGLGRPRDPD